MNKAFLFIVLQLASFCYAQNPNSSFSLVLQKPDDNLFYLTFLEYANGKFDLKEEYRYMDSLNFYDLSYKSFDDLKIGGFIIEPKKKGVYPVLIYNRGGNGDFGTVKSESLTGFLGRIASQGYVIIGSQLRGNSLSEGFDEFGGKDIQDVLSLIPIIDQLPNVDKNRIGVFGWSRGVMTNFLMLKKTNRIKTNIAIAGPADLLTNKRPDMFEVFRKRIPNYTKDSVSVLKSRSSLLAIDSIQNKQLTNFIIQGNKDVAVPVGNAFKLYSKLNAKNFTTRLLIYEDEGHGLDGVTDNLLDQIKAWLQKYL